MTDEPGWFSFSFPTPAPGERVMIVEMPFDDLPRYTRDGREHTSGMKLTRLLEELGGYAGNLRHPFSDEEIFVSVERFRGRNPEKVWVFIAFVDSDDGGG